MPPDPARKRELGRIRLRRFYARRTAELEACAKLTETLWAIADGGPEISDKARELARTALGLPTPQASEE